MLISHFVRAHSLRSVVLLAVLLPYFALSQEICANGVDDDGDGLIDLNDPECVCNAAILPSNTESFIVNHSFEERVVTPIVVGSDTIGYFTCCPFGYSTAWQNWLDCAANWDQATGATSDYYHECGFSPSSFPLPPPDGEAAVGFISTVDYMEYVGACIFDDPLLAGTEYTISLWTAGLSISSTDYQGETQNIGVFYEGIFPLTLYGRTNCLPMPLQTVNLGCLGQNPGWVELARVEYQPDNGWLHVSMTFTPTQEIRQVVLGAPCDLASTYVASSGVIDSSGVIIPMTFFPYTLVDDLTLTLASDQVLQPVASEGRVCLNNVVLTATPPATASNFQWYRDGVALVGQTSATLNVSALGLRGGLYTMTSVFEGQCLLGNTSVWDPPLPDPRIGISPSFGCRPLTVYFRDSAAIATASYVWNFGDDTGGVGAEAEHTYTVDGEYDVSLSIVTEEGCSLDTTLIGAVVVNGLLDGAISATPNPTTVANTTVQLNSAGSTGDIVSWWWDLSEVPPGTSTAAALSVVFPAEAGEYPVTLVVRTAAGCVDTVRSTVVITAEGRLEMPNVFSPNGDGDNDTFLPLETSNVAGQLEVYNRWGQLLFSTVALERGWNGTVEGNDAPAGTYYYLVTPSDGMVEPISGHVMLFR